MALWPSSIPALLADFYANPLGSAKFTALLGELQEVFDTLGINPQGAFGTVAARLAEIDAKTTALANFGLRNLRIVNNIGALTTKLDVTCDSLGIEGSIAGPVSLTIDLSAAGKNGTAVTRTTSTWYYVWLGLNPATGEVCGLLDTDSTRAGLDTTHATLAGFAKWRRVGAWRTNATGSGNLIQGAIQDVWQTYQSAFDNVDFFTDFPDTGHAAAFSDVTVAHVVPPTSKLARILSIGALIQLDQSVSVRRKYDATGNGFMILHCQKSPGALLGGPPGVEFQMELDAAGTFQAKWSSDDASANACRFLVRAYSDTI